MGKKEKNNFPFFFFPILRNLRFFVYIFLCLYRTVEQEGHPIRPFSLQATQVLNRHLSMYTLWLPSHSSHTTNLSPPQDSHPLGSTTGSPWISLVSSPHSFSRRISSAPPTHLPPMKTIGRLRFLHPTIPCSSSRDCASIATSRSSIGTRNPRMMDRTVLQSSKVLRTTRRLV